MKSTFTFWVWCLILSFPGTLFSQTEGNLLGKIVDSETQTPLEYATISIFSSQDSSIVTGDLSDENGLFKFPVPYGEYFAKIEFLSYHSFLVNDLNFSNEYSTIDLGKIELSVNAASLKEVEVLTEKGGVQMNLEKKIFNVSKDLSSSGGNAADVLDNVPSVSIDVEGRVNLRGSVGVQILVDGKPSSVIGDGTAKGLQRLPANMIDRIEVITNPSAKFEAEGTAGIINIVLKKERKIGFNGAVDMTVGYPDIYGFSTNLNVRKNKLNFFTNIGLNFQKNNGGGGFDQTLKEDTLKILELVRDHSLGGLWGNIRLGADYYINDKNTITTSVYYQTGEDNDEVTNEYFNFLGSLDNPTDILVRNDNTTKAADNLEYALTYAHNFGEKGHEIIADIRYQDNLGEDDSDLVESYFDANYVATGANDLLQRSGNIEGESRWITKLDYTYPMSENKKLELGYQGSFRKIQNDFLVEEFNDIEWVIVPEVSNDFEYDEEIYGAYGLFKNKINQFSFNIGARLEYTDIETILVETNDSNPRDYLNFFPNVQFKYDLSNSNALKLSYSRRVRRPTFNDLNPFFTYNDPRNQFQGNPDLDPEFTDSYEFEHLKYWEKGSLSSAVFYRHRTDVINRILEILEGDTTLLRSENLKSQEDLGLEVAGSFSPNPWLEINADGSFFYTQSDGTNINPAYKNSNYTWQGRVTTRFKLPKIADFQLRVNHRAPQTRAQGRSFYITFLDISASRQFWNKKGRLTLAIADVFNTNVYRGNTESPTLYRESEFRWRFRTTRLSFNYRF